jgi:5-methylcytosine-specific restriction endonuclease McrA
MSKDVSIKKRFIIHAKFKGKCAYCGEKLEYSKMHVDHIAPLYRRWTNEELAVYGKVKGTNHIDNLNPSCPTCNISKSTWTIEEWRRELGLKVDRLRRTATNFRLLEKFKLVSVRKTGVKFYFEKFTKEVLDG